MTNESMPAIHIGHTARLWNASTGEGLAGLLDADTNMTYAVKYLAGAYRVANGNTNRAVHSYAAGYYYAAKNKGIPMLSSAQASDSFGGPSNIKFGSDQKLRAFYNRGMTSWSNAYPRPDSY